MDIEFIFRVVFFFVLVSTFAISGAYRKRARDEGETIARREEGTIALILRMAFALPLLAVLLLYVFYPQAIAWSQFKLPLWLRVVGAIFAVACLPIILSVFQNIGVNISETVLTKKGHELVTSGPYRWVRHPLYATSLFLMLSLGLVAQSWFILVYGVAGLIVFRFVVIPTEEENLIASFGDAYRSYQNRTGAIFPKLF